MNFKEWLKLQEVGTGTSSVAMFKRPVFGEPFRRQALGPWMEQDPFFKKRHKTKFSETQFDSDGLPLCPNCGIGLSYESQGNRDGETMGGHSVEYLRCDKCQQGYELVNGQLYPEHGMDPTAYGSTLGSDPDAQTLPSTPLKAQSSMAQTSPQGDQPTLMMPIKAMKRSAKKSNK